MALNGLSETAPYEHTLLPPTRHDVYPFISIDGNLKDAAKGKSVLVTGAGSGIGKAIAKAFVEAGAKTVVITGRRQGQLEGVKADLEKHYPTVKILVVPADVSDDESVKALFETIKAQGIDLDVLVNNAGVHNSQTSIIGSNVKQWWGDYEILLKGPFLTTHYYFKQLQERKSTSGNAIVNVSSSSSLVLMPQQSSYAVPKTALNRFTEWTAAEGKRFGVQAIAYHPGAILNTGMADPGKLPEFLLPYFIDTAELAANVAVYLSTQRAAYLNGRFADATIDLEELEKHKDEIVKKDLLKTGIIGYNRIPLPDFVADMHAQ